MPQAPLIAIVEDDASVRSATESLVRSLGYAACTFVCAEDFLASQERLQARCLISDVKMPGMSGIELQRILRSTGHAIPVIFISAHPEDWARRQAEAAGAYGFLSKPFDADAMISCIEAAIGPPAQQPALHALSACGEAEDGGPA